MDYKINDLELVNMESMPRGLNCRYLLCLLSHHTPPKLIATQWKRKIPVTLPMGYAILDMEDKIENKMEWRIKT